MPIPIINKNKCLRCGLCTALYSEMFEMGDVGIKIKNTKSDKSSNVSKKIENVSKNCPGKAIK